MQWSVNACTHGAIAGNSLSAAEANLLDPFNCRSDVYA